MTNTTTRVLVATVAIPFILACAFIGGVLWFAFVAILLYFALDEFYRLTSAKGAHPQKIAGFIASLFLLIVFFHERMLLALREAFGSMRFSFPQQWQFLMILCVMIVLVLSMIELFRNKGSAILNLGTTMLGIFYLGLFFGCAVGLREIFSVSEFPVAKYFGGVILSDIQTLQLHHWGGYTMCAILTTIWICDTAAFFGGKALGKHPLFARVSPKKTWEGAIFGFVFSVLWMLLMQFLFLPYLAIIHAFVIGVIIGTVGQVGDLIESLMKRDAQIKDSSAKIPGHGGVFDRFDSLLFVAPALYLYVDFIVFA